ncbi:hypothetical protein [Streptomyces mayteni]
MDEKRELLDLLSWEALFRRLDVVYTSACMMAGNPPDPMVRVLILSRMSQDLAAMAGHAKSLAAAASTALAGQVVETSRETGDGLADEVLLLGISVDEDSSDSSGGSGGEA